MYIFSNCICKFKKLEYFYFFSFSLSTLDKVPVTTCVVECFRTGSGWDTFAPAGTVPIQIWIRVQEGHDGPKKSRRKICRALRIFLELGSL
jgi:hypothetical protein